MKLNVCDHLLRANILKSLDVLPKTKYAKWPKTIAVGSSDFKMKRMITV